MKFELKSLKRNTPNEEIIAEIRRVNLLVGKDNLTQADYNKYGKISSYGLKLRFGGTWEKVLEVAGLGHKYVGTKISEKMLSQKAQFLTDHEVLDELKRVAKELNKKFLLKKDFRNNSELSCDTFLRRFGSWQNALKIAGLEHKYSGKIVTEKMHQQKAKSLTNEDILHELKRIAELLKKETVTKENLNYYSDIVGSETIRRRFGSWANALASANLKNSPFGKRFSLDDYFENLLVVWTHYGRQPLYREMNVPPSKITAPAYENRFGGWRKALETFVEKMNQNNKDANISKKEKKQEINITESKIAKPIEIIRPSPPSIKDRRDIILSLRYRVLSRDKFKCIRCGSSPATDISCKLHVDHIVPFSKGGRTTLDNLQTLCKKCNLGKGNRHSE